MITMDSLEAQLKKVDFNVHGWGRSEAKELIHILHEHEEIHDLVNGYYDGGFALLVATSSRIMLVDKKPFNFLTVEDVRYEMITEIDYSHRLIGAHVNIITGNNKTMRFTSLNQARLRKTVGHVQHCIAESKKDQSEHASSQKEHLAQINQQLQSYLLAQHQQQIALRDQLEAVKEGQKKAEEVRIEAVKPSHELSDYLFAQSLLAKAKQEKPELELPQPNVIAAEIIHSAQEPIAKPASFSEETSNQIDDLYEEGMKEIFGTGTVTEVPKPVSNDTTFVDPKVQNKRAKQYGRMLFFQLPGGVEVHPFRMAYRMTAKSMKKRRLEKEAASPEASYAPKTPEEPAPMNHRIFQIPV